MNEATVSGDNVLVVVNEGDGRAKLMMVWTMPVQDAKAMIDLLVARDVVPPTVLASKRSL